MNISKNQYRSTGGENRLKLLPVITRFNLKIKANLFGCLDRLELANPQLLNLWAEMLDTFIMRRIVLEIT
jgi:hypothetical protein